MDQRQKTLAEEALERLEEKVKKDFEYSNKFSGGVTNQVADLFNKAAISDQRKANIEKLKGQFRLKINHNLSMPKKIEKYAEEPIVFYLHKKRNFIKKLNSSI